MRIFSFSHTWSLPADSESTYAALADVDAYPEWWPQVRRVERIDEASGHAFVRSLLPYTLDLVLTKEIEDAVAGVLRVRIGGDLEGWSQWRLEPALGGTTAHYTQEAAVTARGLDHFAPVAGLVLRANHFWMMRSGERGLVARLAADGETGSRIVGR